MWESEQDEDSVYEPTDEPTDEESESERDGPSDGEETDLEKLIRQRLADRHDKGSPSVSNQVTFLSFFTIFSIQDLF